MKTEVTTEIKIKKASLKDDQLELVYDQIIEDPELGPVINTFKLNSGNRPHEDLKKSFQTLRFHVAMIAEQIQAGADMQISISGKGGKKKDITALLDGLHTHPIVQAITVTGFSIGGSDESEGVTIVAQRALSTGSVLNLITPFTKWESEYKYSSDLEPEVSVAIQECLEFINGKYAPNPQLEMNLVEKGEEE